MTVSRREALILGAAVPVSGLVLTSARGQVPQQQQPGGQGYGEDPILSACLLIDGRKQIEICRWAKERAKADDVKAFAQAEIDEHEKIKADLKRLGFEYPAPPQFGNEFQQGGQFQQPGQFQPTGQLPQSGTSGTTVTTSGQSSGQPTTGTGSTASQAVTGVPPVSSGFQQHGPKMIAVGRLILPPGLDEIVALSHEVADQCVANARTALEKKAGEGKFDKAFVGMQLHEHYALLDKCQVFEKHSTDRMREVLQQGRPIIERHIATLESLCKKLERDGGDGRPADTGRKSGTDRGTNPSRPDAPDRY